jgi:hypothetical protein
MIIFKQIKQFVDWMNEKGVPVPLARIDKKPSVSFTLLIMSAAFVMLGLIDPVVHLGINVWEALAWHATSAVLYYNRTAKISKDGLEIGSSEEEKKED